MAAIYLDNPFPHDLCARDRSGFRVYWITKFESRTERLSTIAQSRLARRNRWEHLHMALYSDAAMVLYYDIAGDNADHDDWHTYEHIYERLSIPGFLRATRWVAIDGTPHYMVIYEVSGIKVGNSPAYLARLNDPTVWTASMMGRFRGMVRGFCSAVASVGYGMGCVAVSLRFTPTKGTASSLIEGFGREIFPQMLSRRGIASLHLLRPAPPPPMTKEQSIRGPDTSMTWGIFATAYEADALRKATVECLLPEALQLLGASSPMNVGTYTLHFTASAQEVARTAPNPPLSPDAPRR